MGRTYVGAGHEERHGGGQVGVGGLTAEEEGLGPHRTHVLRQDLDDLPVRQLDCTRHRRSRSPRRSWCQPSGPSLRKSITCVHRR